MLRNWKLLIVGVFAMVVILAGCGPKGEVALKVTGAVAGEKGWTESQVKDMKTMQAESVNKSGEASTYTGVSIMDLLTEAQLNEDATMVTFVADDGYTAEVSLDELKACPDCIVSFRDQGGFSIVMPDFSSKLQVKGVVEIQVK
jgi:hypothetical protein